MKKLNYYRFNWEPLVIGVFSFLILVLTLSAIGLTWDEPFYIIYPLKYFEWFKSPHLSTITSFFPNEAHPPFGKYITGGGVFLFSSFLSPLTSARLGIIFISSLFISFVFLITKEFYGREAAYFSSISLLFLPRFFGHMHLAELDIPLSFFFFLSTYAFYRGLHSKKWSIAFGILQGLTISIKSSGAFLFPSLLIWAFVFRKKEAWRNFVASLISPLIFFLLWPRMWVNPVLHFKEFFLHQIIRIHIPLYYLGEVYKKGMSVPWHYPLVMIFFTLPFFLLIFSIFGIGLFSKKRKEDSVFLFPLLFFLFMVSLPKAPKYDGVRLFLPIFPFFCFYAGKAFLFIKEIYLGKKYYFLYFFLIPSILSLFLIQPFYLSYYNILAGGLKGAERKGMELTYWGDSINKKVFKWINKNSSYHSKISFYPAGFYQVKFYSYLGFLRKDLKGEDTISKDSEYVVLQMREGLFNKKCRELIKSGNEVFLSKKSGIPLVRVYKVRK